MILFTDEETTNSKHIAEFNAHYTKYKKASFPLNLIKCHNSNTAKYFYAFPSVCKS